MKKITEQKRQRGLNILQRARFEGALTAFETTLKLINSDDRVPEDVKDELRTCCINATDKVKELEEILNQ